MTIRLVGLIRADETRADAEAQVEAQAEARRHLHQAQLLSAWACASAIRATARGTAR